MMSEGPSSPLPTEPEYWERLASRVRADAAAPLAAYAAEGPWYAVLARRAPWLVAASIAATVVLWLSMPSPQGIAIARWLESSLAPEEAAGTLIAGPEPPRVDVLMAQFSPPTGDGREQ